MAANLSGVLLRLASVVVHPDASKNNEQGPSIICILEPLQIIFEILVASQAAWDCRSISLLNPLLYCRNTSAVICLDISVELNRNETVNIMLAREQQGIIKYDLQCDIEWPFECHAVRYVLMQEGSPVDSI